MKGELGLGGILVDFLIQMLFSCIWIFLHVRTRQSDIFSILMNETELKEFS